MSNTVKSDDLDREPVEVASPNQAFVPAVYATAAQYRNRTGAGNQLAEAASTALDELLDEMLASASRLIDNDLEVVPGYFAPTEATHVYATDGGTTLRFRNEAGLAHCLRAVAPGGIKPDYELSGVFDQESWDLEDVWIWPRPRNAATYNHPYFALELRLLSDVVYGNWPTGGGGVEITGSWGWPAVPAPIRDLTVHVARQMRDSMRGGGAARVEAIDDVVAYRDDAWRLWQSIKRDYGRHQSRVRMRSV